VEFLVNFKPPVVITSGASRKRVAQTPECARLGGSNVEIPANIGLYPSPTGLLFGFFDFGKQALDTGSEIGRSQVGLGTLRRPRPQKRAERVWEFVPSPWLGGSGRMHPITSEPIKAAGDHKNNAKNP